MNNRVKIIMKKEAKSFIGDSMISRNEFLVLTEIEKNDIKLTQKEISELVGLSVGLVNKIIKTLTENNYIKEMKITELGYDVLEPYRVKRAIFIAAGFGSRLVPVTLNTPKPLIKVNGKRMIETLLDAVVKVGIEEIIIVRGYLGEQFDVLLKKYPNIKFYDNDKYNTCNNISSALLVADKYQNAYVMDADLILTNTDVITKYQYQSNYVGVKVDYTDDWCLDAGKNMQIENIKVGGTNTYLWVGISYWTAEDGKKLEKDIPAVFDMPGGKERYWDQVALEYFKDKYKVYIRPFEKKDVVEIDNYDELIQIDPIYKIN